MGAFLDGPAHSKCLENVGGRNARFWPKSRIWKSKNRGHFPKLAQNNVWFFLLPSTTIYILRCIVFSCFYCTGQCTPCRGVAESVLTLSSTLIGVGLHDLVQIWLVGRASTPRLCLGVLAFHLVKFALELHSVILHRLLCNVDSWGGQVHQCD